MNEKAILRLTQYSALKVAENFRLLEALYPGRIDLGIGRTPGSDALTAAALAYPGMVHDVRHFPQHIVDLLAHLSDTLKPTHPFAGVHPGPGTPVSVPEVWLLGSCVESAHLAAKLGLPFVMRISSAWGLRMAPPSSRATAGISDRRPI